MTNNSKALRKSATLRTTLTFVVAISPFIVHLIYFCLSTHKIDYIASTILLSVVTLVLVWKYASYYLVFWCILHQNHASIKECVVQSVEECSEELSKECSEDIKFPLTSVFIDAVKRMYFISILIFAINLAPLCNIKFPEANDTGVLLVTCFSQF